MALIDTGPESPPRSAPARRRKRQRFRLLRALEELGQGRVGLLYLGDPRDHRRPKDRRRLGG
ncbi:MAG: hypothetical protein JST59_27170 [Actinobacteria bacterium]|nr:hypothetical protein [Actinomycetota bacterium]